MPSATTIPDRPASAKDVAQELLASHGPALTRVAFLNGGLYSHLHRPIAIQKALRTPVVGALVSPRTQTSWEAAGIAAAVGTSAGAAWEIAEWVGLKLGARGMNLSYDDTMADLIETTAGAVVMRMTRA